MTTSRVFVNRLPVGLVLPSSVGHYQVSLEEPQPARAHLLAPLLPSGNAEWHSLPPPLQVSLPEGAFRRELVSRLGCGNHRWQDLTLLNAVGLNLIGSVSVAPSFQKWKRGQSVVLPLASALSLSDSEIQSLALDNKKTWPGLSGGFLKVLLSTVGDTPVQAPEQWIVKFGDADRPTIAVVEFFGMRLAKDFGLEVPQVVLAGGATRLMVRRFDLTEEGDPLAFEDMCALQGANATDKFSSSAESVVKTIARFCPPETRVSSLEAFFCQYLLAAVIRNGDAHLKNFGLLHDDNWPAALSPVYDMLSMAIYAPRANNGDAQDGMALTLAGTRRWPTHEAIAQLGLRCALSLDRQAHWKDRLRIALLRVGSDVVEFATQTPPPICSRRALKRMLELWSHGAALLDIKTQGEMRKLALSISVY